MAKDRAGQHGSPMTKAATPTSGKKSHKRKRELDGATTITSSTPTKKPKKSESTSPTPASAKERRKSKKRANLASSDHQKESTKKKGADSVVSKNDTTPSKDSSILKTKKKSKTANRRFSGSDTNSDDEATGLRKKPTKDFGGSERVGGRDDANKGDRIELSRSDPATNEEKENSHPIKNKFSGILSKFERSAKVKEAADAKGYAKEEKDKDLNPAEPVIAQGLEPLPQPEIVVGPDEKPTYSSLPTWLANPIRTSSETRTKFSDLGIDTNLLGVLEGNGYKEAFAVQSAVIPLLLKGSKNHPGDLCVSAATGSGKTLSYVLPLVKELEQIPAPRLRGLIVVPTRELVKQAREACELCAAGSGLRIGSAVGNVAIKDEQRLLMRTDQVYSPETIRSRQAELTSEEWTNFNLQDYISNTIDLGETLPGYIRRADPNIDILICTPGRLVDHIRYTESFTLKHLQWLVIDEADRLLNESFQEWVDVVINSLDAGKDPVTFGSSGQFLSNLGLPLQTKEPRKVILSATMTRDISKLNSLRLTNPKLVIIGSSDPPASTGEESGIVVNSDDRFTLPSTLKEFSVSVGDGSQKPLYLLRLLLSHIKVDISQSAKRPAPATSDSKNTSSGESSSEDSTSEDSSSDESSSEDSSADSDSLESDSDSDSESSDDSSSSSSDSEFDSDSEAFTKQLPNPTSARSTVLVFTKSSESASRLSRLLSLLKPSLADRIGTIIKSNKSSASRKTLTAYRRGKLSIIIATDRASRGLDLESLTHVVNYDIPTSVTTYVHRVGRTARAGKDGSAWTLVAHREGRWFTNEISKGTNGKIIRSAKVEKMPLKLENAKEQKSKYAAALDVLEKEVMTGGAKKTA